MISLILWQMLVFTGQTNIDPKEYRFIHKGRLDLSRIGSISQGYVIQNTTSKVMLFRMLPPRPIKLDRLLPSQKKIPQRHHKHVIKHYLKSTSPWCPWQPEFQRTRTLSYLFRYIYTQVGQSFTHKALGKDFDRKNQSMVKVVLGINHHTNKMELPIVGPYPRIHDRQDITHYDYRRQDQTANQPTDYPLLLLVPLSTI